MLPTEFAAKWTKAALGESQAYQEHFIDVCQLVGQPTPVEADPNGTWFSFQKLLKTTKGGFGWADVWRKDHFAWEYKGPHKDLDAALTQLLKYHGPLGNPPLLVVCDLKQFQVHTKFTNSVSAVYSFTNQDIAAENVLPGTKFTALDVLRAIFTNPDKLRPDRTPAQLTEEAAILLGKLADDMRKQRVLTGLSDQQIAHFLVRMIFCFFATDVGLLPRECFTDVIRLNKNNPQNFRKYLSQLFAAMHTGGDFNMRPVPHFDGGLFDNNWAPDLIADHILELETLDGLSWTDIEPSIFGTLFERILDPSKRRQLGLHYTSRDDIQRVVEPVLMAPLRREWEKTKARAATLANWQQKPERTREKARVELQQLLSEYIQHISSVRVLDPACGSGNFLYVSLAALKELEKEVITTGALYGIGGLSPKVHPRQLFGIEIDAYAWNLASAVVWIGYLQWKARNGLDLKDEDPILQPLHNIQRMDAILERNKGIPREPAWPDADVIVGNPPFLGGKLLRRVLDDTYVEGLFKVYEGRVPAEADLVCYWHEKAREAIEKGHAKRAGLLATQGIRGGANRRVLERIKQSGDIFLAYSDEPWVLDGAAVHVSIVGFDNGSEVNRVLDGQPVQVINANLTAGLDLTKARRLKENIGVAFMGDTKGGPFEIPGSLAFQMLNQPNPHGKSNQEVLRPWVNGLDITRRPRGMWIIDFGTDMTLEEAALFEAPFEYVKQNVKPRRAKSNTTIEQWWLHERPRVEMRAALATLQRFIVTPCLSKHRPFFWVPMTTLPDHQLIAVARDDDCTFGVLHSRVHEVWALNKGTQLENRPRYTPTTTFETFPFPKGSSAQCEAIADAARELNDHRDKWLNPVDPLTPDVKQRTLTNLYNKRPTWLEQAHCKLDHAVLDAYGWPHEISDGEILDRLLTLNLQREPV